MKLVIRAQVPITLEGILEAYRSMRASETGGGCTGPVWQRIRDSSAPYRSTCKEEKWKKEEAALEQLRVIWPEKVSLYVQKLPVPAGLPLSLVQLWAGMAIAEDEKWSHETFSPLAMLWLQEIGAKPLAQLNGKVLRIESAAGIGLIELETAGAGEDLPLVKEHRNHTEEHVDEGMLLIQVNLDDSSPEWLAHVMEECFRAGANDVHFLPVTMKKSRPGILLQVLCYRSQLEALKTILFAQTTTFGVRYFPVACHRLARRFITVVTQWGEVTVKIGYHRGQRVQIAPEYSVCAQLATAAHVPLKQVYRQAIRLAEDVSCVNLP